MHFDGLPLASSALVRFLLLYVSLYAAYGAESVYLPAFLQDHRLTFSEIGIILAAGTLVRIVAGPAIGRLADWFQAPRLVLAAASAASAAFGLGYIVAFGFLPLLMVSMANAVAIAPLAPLSDALALAASSIGPGFQYGWVRGAGSAAFVAATLLSGQLVDRFGLASIIVTSSGLFAVTAIFARRVGSQCEGPRKFSMDTVEAFRTLWRTTVFRRLVLVAALLMGSHSLNDAFAVINWRQAGLGTGAISILWSESVVAEVVVFFAIGPWLLLRLGPAGAASVAAVAGVVRWTVMGSTSAVAALILVQTLHGLTFALFHLAAMRLIALHVAQPLSATAQTFYGTFALGISSVLLTIASGYLYAELGQRAFWAMALLCALSLPLIWGLRGRG